MTQLLTTAEAARELEISVSRISQLVAAGKIAPAQKLPGVRGALLFDPTVVDRYRAQRDVGSATELQP